MFIFFHQNKLRHKKGQLVLIFIVVLTVLLIMAMITVNLAKVSSIKTESSNAADAGALAGGSVMAGIFNAQAVVNSELFVVYQEFLVTMGSLAAIASVAAFLAASICAAGGCFNSHHHLVCCPSGGCKAAAGVAQAGVIAAMVSVSAFHIAQVFAYMNMRKQAKEGREQAIELAYRYAFINSGIGNKLITGSPLVAPEDKRGDDNNYSDTFNDFLKSAGVTSGNYAWIDGQGRQHQVNVNVTVQDVDSYKLRYAALPTAAILAFLKNALVCAGAEIIGCAACRCTSPSLFLLAKDLAISMGVALAGLVPGWEFNVSAAANIAFPICWVVDINHNRRLSVTTRQEHGKQDYGLWEAVYPRVQSRSVINFSGSGKIYPPKPRFDTDITEAD